MITKFCLKCGKPFKTYPCLKDRAKYCSPKCAGKMKGKPWSNKEATFLKENWKNMPDKEIAQKLRRRLGSVKARRIRCGLLKRKYRNLIKNPNYLNLTPEKSYILGTLCGDGYITKVRNVHYAIGLNTIDKDFADYFSRQIKKWCGLETITHLRKDIYGIFPNGKISKGKPQFGVKLHSKQVYQYIYKNYGGLKTSNWCVPKEILQSNNEKIIGMFLKGFFDSEGCVNYKWISGSSINKDGLRQVQQLLKNLKIETKIRERKNKGRRPLYEIQICCKYYLELFLEKIGFSIKRKQKHLEGVIKSKKYGLLKDGSKEIVIEIKKTYGWGGRKIHRYLKNNGKYIPERTIYGWLENRRGRGEIRRGKGQGI